MAHLRMGTRGWQPTAWHGEYYPEDLPEDWQLSYYSNEFSAVLVPESDWMSATDDEIDDWLDDIDDSFRFYLEIERSDYDMLPCQQRMEQLGEHLAGFVFLHEATVTGACSTHCFLPLISDEDYTPQEKYWVLAQGVEAVSCHASLVFVDPGSSLRNLKSQFGQFADFEGDFTVIVRDTPVNPQFMTELRTLLELMGVA